MVGEASDDENVPYASQKQKNKKSGGFQCMGLDFAVLKGILRKGYKIPTPIQRKTIPLILGGKDVVAMARTGSGKTAAFLVPLLQKLKRRCLKAGARALLISPTRELAIQTLKFTKELGRFTDLKISLLVGGDSMEEQFAAIHENPDIIIATPGRLVHVAVEMNLKLNSVEYVVFDEADRLFEMGFEEQLKETLARLPESRQTLLFSATLPKTLIDFVKAGLCDPTLVRLDVDSKISENLQMSFLFCRFEDKPAALLHLLSHVIDVDREQTIVFCATKHHVEYLQELLTKLSFSCTFVYSSLDATARKINVEKFRKKKASVLLVTDLAARGVDIPLLDNVVNLHFVPRAKLFVHRVGRVARAGRSGRAFSFISAEEMPYVVDLFLFLGRPMNFIRSGTNNDSDVKDAIGSFPRAILETDNETITTALDGNDDLNFIRQGSLNAYKQYVRTRPTPSRESVERVKKEHLFDHLGIHPLFNQGLGGNCYFWYLNSDRPNKLSQSFLKVNFSGTSSEEVKCEEMRSSILDGLKNYKPKITVFEMNTSNKDQCWLAMKAKRKAHNKIVSRTSVTNLCDKGPVDCDFELVSHTSANNAIPGSASGQDMKNVFSEIIESKFRPNKSAANISDKNKAKKMKKLQIASSADSEYFLPYQPKDFHQEHGLSLKKSAFEQEATSAVVDFTTDDATDMHRQKNKLLWDRKRKRFVREDENSGKNKKIKTESGVWIPASYKSDLYARWLKKSKSGHRTAESDEEEESQLPLRSKRFTPKVKVEKKMRKNGFESAKSRKPTRNEIRSKEQIMKERKKKEKTQSFHTKRQKTAPNSKYSRKGR